ncbi:MAG: MFS transporter, partial [Planctomycetaceae bacterium]|nr:MFS transporter [Planctomycetaceae bacterium]
MTGSDFDAAAPPADPPSSARTVVLISLCAAAAIAYVQRNCIGVAESTIRAELGMTKQQMGWALSGFFLTYSLFQIPTGWLGERLGPRKTLSIYSAVWSGATAITGLAGIGIVAVWLVPLVMRIRPGIDTAAASLLAAIWWLYAVRLLSGIGQAGLFPCSAVVISQWFPQSQRASVSGWLGTSQQVGAIIASGLTGLLLAMMDWRVLFAVFALPGLIWAWFFYVWFRDRPRAHTAVNAAELSLISRSADGSVSSDSEQPDETDGTPTPTPWLALLASPPMWCICGQQFCRGAGYMFYASWFPTFLQETRNVSVTKSGLLTMLPLIASGIGSALAGKLSDRMLSATGNVRAARRNVAVAGMFGCALLIFAAYFVQGANTVVLVISGGAFCAALAGPSGYATTIDMGGKNVATIFATMNMAGNA